MVLQPETGCRNRVGPGGPSGAGQPSGPGARLSSSVQTTQPNPQRPCTGGGSGRRNCGKTPLNLGKNPGSWGNPPLISRSNPWASHFVASGMEAPDMAKKIKGLAWSTCQGPRLGPMGPCVQLTTETAWDWPQPGTSPSPSWGAGGSAAAVPDPAAVWLRRRWTWLLAVRVRGPSGWSAWG